MKTAIINTNYWKEDKIFSLTPDVRYFYLCLLTNPERNTTQAFKCSNRLLSAYTGYNNEVIELCKNKLIECGFIKIVDDYFILNDQDYVKATKGKLSQVLYDKYFETLPENVKDLLLSHSGATPEYKDKGKDKGKDSDKDVDNDENINNMSFDLFWSEYPQRRVDKDKCKKKFLSFKEDLQKQIIEDVKNRKENDEKWIKGFVPMTSTYLNNKKWEDDLEEIKKVNYVDLRTKK